MLENIIRSIGAAVGVWMYVIAGALVFAEASIFVGFVLPGETALLVAGVFTRPPGHLNLWVMIAIAVACAVAGDTVSYEIGQRFGPRVRASRLGSWIGQKRWGAAESFVHRHGGKAVFLGRLVALMRALTPAVAGMTGLSYRRFLPWNAAGGLVWGAGCVLLGWAFASALGVVGRTLTWAPLVIVALVVSPQSSRTSASAAPPPARLVDDRRYPTWRRTQIGEPAGDHPGRSASRLPRPVDQAEANQVADQAVACRARR